jgi:hypothetical protein
VLRVVSKCLRIFEEEELVSENHIRQAKKIKGKGFPPNTYQQGCGPRMGVTGPDLRSVLELTDQSMQRTLMEGRRPRNTLSA